MAKAAFQASRQALVAMKRPSEPRVCTRKRNELTDAGEESFPVLCMDAVVGQPSPVISSLVQPKNIQLTGLFPFLHFLEL